MSGTLVYECFSGISGDMHIGAMIDVGVPVDHFRTELARLSLGNEFDLVVEPGAKMGITGTKATVAIDTATEPGHRHLPRIHRLIEEAGLNTNVTTIAKDIFQVLAEAEAKIHGIEVDKVHFHEVGATDSIVDIVAAAIGIDYLAPDQILCGPVELGSGMVKCAHGIMPVPAPATAEILKDVPTTRGRVSSEATTPTGAAILKTVVDRFAPPRVFTAAKIGYGIGQKDFEVPNVLRTSWGRNEPSAYETETNIEIECNIDDMNPEGFEPLMGSLFDAGAKDVFMTPISMKKSRPGTKLSILVDERDVDRVLERVFTGSTTLGVRIHPVTKHMLPREQITVETTMGPVRVKVALLPDGHKRWKSEHDDIAAIASDSGRDYLGVKAAIDAELDKHFDS